MRRIEALLALAAITNAQGVPRPTRLRIYEVRTALRFDEGELQRVNFRYDRSSGIKSDIARSLVDVGLTTDRGFVFEVAFFGTEDLGQVKARCHRSKPRLRRRPAAQPLGDVAAAGVGARRRDRPRAARGDGRRLRPHRRRRDFVADDPEPGGRDPLPRAGAVSTIVPRVPVPTLLLRARSRRYISPHHAFPFQRGEPCARVFLFQPLLPTTRYNHPPRCKISSEAPSFGGP